MTRGSSTALAFGMNIASNVLLPTTPWCPISGGGRGGSLTWAFVILSDRTLREQLAAGRIVIDPLDESLIQPSSIDVRISNLFRVFRNHTRGVIDVKHDMVDLTELVEIAPRVRIRSSSIQANSSSGPRSNASACLTTSWGEWKASRHSGGSAS